VTGGGLAADGKSWKMAKRRGKYLFPTRVMASVFRGKLLVGLRHLRKQSKLRFEGSCADLVRNDVFDAFIQSLFERKWVAYAKKTFMGAQHVFDYLGRYTHRVGISNQRLKAVSDEAVVFVTKDGRQARVAPVEFLRRLMMHVLPRGFVKIRHYGLLAGPNVRTLLASAMRRLGSEPPPTAPASVDWATLLFELTGIDVRICCQCGGVLARTGLPRFQMPARAGPIAPQTGGT
jgi:hypothetical protein